MILFSQLRHPTYVQTKPNSHPIQLSSSRQTPDATSRQAKINRSWTPARSWERGRNSIRSERGKEQITYWWTSTWRDRAGPNRSDQPGFARRRPPKRAIGEAPRSPPLAESFIVASPRVRACLKPVAPSSASSRPSRSSRRLFGALLCDGIVSGMIPGNKRTGNDGLPP